MRTSFLRFVIAIGANIGCVVSWGEKAHSAVIGSDERTVANGAELPRAVGRLDLGNGGWCTATLVAPDIVVTAAHCVIDPTTGTEFSSISRFIPNGSPQEFEGIQITERWAGTRDPNNDRGNDWGLLRLESAIGNEVGWMTLVPQLPRPLSELRGQLVLAGYSLDFRLGKEAGVHRGCSLLAEELDYYLHQCDAGPGASGAALWWSPQESGQFGVTDNSVHNWQTQRETFLVAIHSSSSFGINLAVRTEKVHEALQKILSGQSD